MENRFGFKDLVNAALLLVLIVSVWVAMKQFDRQWDQVRLAREDLRSLAAEQAAMRRDLGEILARLEKGVVGTLPTTQAMAGEGADRDPFVRLKAAKAMPEYAPGDWFVDTFGAKVARVTPLISTDAYAAAVQERVLETLAVRDPETLEWAPLVARSWSVSEDGLTIAFELRRGVSFSDGHPLTAADVEFTYNLIMNEAIDAPRDRNLMKGKLGSVKAEGDYRVVFRFLEPYFESFGQAATLQIMPKHFYERYTPEQINREPGLLLGSGPYRMESATTWAPDRPLQVVRNERYWGETPAFDRLVWREMNNEAARLTAYRNGEIDIFAAMPDQYLKVKDDPQFTGQSQFYEYERPSGGYGFIAWNQRRGGKSTPFADKRVRQAMAHLYDRERMNREILKGFGIFPSGPFNRLSKQYDPAVENWPYDPERAKALLAEAGYKDTNADGVIEGPDGAPFRFKITFSSGDFWPTVMLMIRDSMAKAGIVMDLDPLEWSVFDERLKSRDFDALAMAWGGSIEGDIHQMFHSSGIAEGDNFTAYKNPDLDALIEKARRTVKEEQRMPLWQQCHRILHEDQPYLFLYSRKALVYVDNRFRNVQRIRLGLNDQTEWFAPRNLQRWTRN